MNVPELDTDKETVLILAGDIGIAKRPTTYKYFLEDMSERFREVIMILGNHEHYGGNFPTTYTKIYEACLDFENVSILEKEAIWLDGVAFIGATLWTDMGNHDAQCIEQSKLWMNDYKTVRTGPSSEPWKRKLHPHDTVADHMNAKHYIFEEIKKQKAEGRKVVVIGHHLPSYLSVAEEFKGDPVNGAYASELFEDIMDLGDDQPEFFIHGHTHSSFDYMIGNTRIVCNPRGYLTQDPSDLNPNFDPCLTFEV
jgi:calcineurin-like phosphoesterase family protein